MKSNIQEIKEKLNTSELTTAESRAVYAALDDYQAKSSIDTFEQRKRTYHKEVQDRVNARRYNRGKP